MEGLRYEAPETLQGAVALLAGASGPARVLAGGTDVIVQMETDLIEPQLLVDIKKIAEVRQIAAENVGFRIGAAATGMEIMGHAALCKDLAEGYGQAAFDTAREHPIAPSSLDPRFAKTKKIETSTSTAFVVIVTAGWTKPVPDGSF